LLRHFNLRLHWWRRCIELNWRRRRNYWRWLSLLFWFWRRRFVRFWFRFVFDDFNQFSIFEDLSDKIAIQRDN
jgi:hypothetical protein